MGQQLDFSVLLNPSVKAEDEPRLSQQATKIYKLFMERHEQGAYVANTELMQISCQYQARLYEVRRELIKRNLCIDLVRKGDNGVNYYSVVELDKSTFYAEHKDTL